MIKVEEAKNIILCSTASLEIETVDISSALNRILAEDIYSSENIPAFNNSAMDGYAIVTSSLNNLNEEFGVLLEIAGNIPAGSTSDLLPQEGNAVKIMTGAPVPIGYDSIVPVEYTEAAGGKVRILENAKKWDNIRFAGEDVKKGELVLKKGEVLNPAKIGMLAALNFKDVKVTVKPKIAILATGDELIGPGEALLPGKVRNINSYSLYSMVISLGCDAINLGVAKDNERDIREKLNRRMECDVLIISGGVSEGDYDYTKIVLKEMGLEEKFWKVAVKPGKPLLFGVLGRTLVFGLPGNPVSSMIAFQEFVLPAIYKLQGRNEISLKELTAVLEGNINKKADRTYFLTGKYYFKENKLYVKPMKDQGSGIFSSAVRSNCLIVASEEISRIKNGEEVKIQITNEIGE